jgi:DNA invertase Pin-like site-specific DNA recombinase
VSVQFIKESLTFTGEDSPMANLLLSVMGAFAEFERSLIRERQREGIALAKKKGCTRGESRHCLRNVLLTFGGEQGTEKTRRLWRESSASPGRLSTVRFLDVKSIKNDRTSRRHNNSIVPGRTA